MFRLAVAACLALLAGLLLWSQRARPETPGAAQTESGTVARGAAWEPRPTDRLPERAHPGQSTELARRGMDPAEATGSIQGRLVDYRPRPKSGFRGGARMRATPVGTDTRADPRPIDIDLSRDFAVDLSFRLDDATLSGDGRAPIEVDLRPDGSFEFEDLAAGSWSIGSGAECRFQVMAQQVDVRAGEPASVTLLALYSDTTPVVVRASDRFGEWQKGRPWRVELKSQPLGTARWNAIPGGKSLRPIRGRQCELSVALVPGTVQAVGSLTGTRGHPLVPPMGAEVLVDYDGGRAPLELELSFDLDSSPTRVSGRVVDDASERFASFEVVARSRLGAPSRAMIRLDESGGFWFDVDLESVEGPQVSIHSILHRRELGPFALTGEHVDLGDLDFGDPAPMAESSQSVLPPF